MWPDNGILHPDFTVNVKVLINEYEIQIPFVNIFLDNTLFF
jgi:hypothetical protein